MESQYTPQSIEAAVQSYWTDNDSFVAKEDFNREKFYCLAMFPYPSGKLHMGHVRNYTITDVIARYQRMLGKNVLHPMGWDAFGLPAENAAIQNKTAPAKWTYQNIDYMKSQLKSLGFSFDWSRELATCKPNYYRWEQWFFTQLYEKGLVYKKMSSVNWDPVDCTVLANEQVIDGKGWRSGANVERREIPQWFIKITDYAEELLTDLNELDQWPEQVKTMQRNWIGKSRGADIQFKLEADSVEKCKKNGVEFTDINVYTTRPDTLMGASYVSIAAEHPIALALSKDDAVIASFVAECKAQSVAEADMATMEKKGMDTGLTVNHPLTEKALPVWIANYVLMDYGSGAVMAVPAHDERDFAFAKNYQLPIQQVIQSTLADDTAFTVEHWQEWYARKTDIKTVHSGPFDNLDFSKCFDAITQKLTESGLGAVKINYRLRDWGVSRQRYWGTPIPMFNLPEGGEIPVPADRLPILLPEDVTMDGVQSPIKADPEWAKATLNGQAVEQETDTFDTFMESSWYYARFTCPDFDEGILDPERANYWLPVDQYVGGIEHAILHLLYARFFHKLLRDANFVNSNEPFKRLLCQGMVLADSFYRENQDGSKTWFNPTEVAFDRDEKGKILTAKLIATGEPIIVGGMTKMSKSKNNGIDPQTAIDAYGADTVRVFTMFAAPPEQTLEWNDDGVSGAQRFLKRLWNYCTEHHALIASGLESLNENGLLKTETVAAGPASEKMEQVRHEIHTALEKSLNDFERNQFNTVIAGCMTILNHLPTDPSLSGVAAEGCSTLLRLLSPIAPHICQHLWQQLNLGEDIVNAQWPCVDSSALTKSTIELVLQVNGKVRAKLNAAADTSKDQLEAMALENDNVKKFIGDQTVRKVIVVPGKLVNIVAK